MSTKKAKIVANGTGYVLALGFPHCAYLRCPAARLPILWCFDEHHRLHYGSRSRTLHSLLSRVPVRSILSYLDLPTQPPPLSPARAPPQGLFEFDQTGGFDPADPEPVPEFEFDQSLPD